MKGLLLIISMVVSVMPLFAQLYQPGEVLEYRVSYRAKMFPNTEVGEVEVTTTAIEDEGKTLYKVHAFAQTLSNYRWIFPLYDQYTIYVDSKTLKPNRFESSLVARDYSYRSVYDYNWAENKVSTESQSRQNPIKYNTIDINSDSHDAISLFFNMRSADSDKFEVGEEMIFQMVLPDTIREVKCRFLGREEKKIRNMGRYNTLKFACQLGTSEGFSFTDGTTFLMWISDDKNKIPLYLESPIRIGSVCAYISGYDGLKYPVDSRIGR